MSPAPRPRGSKTAIVLFQFGGPDSLDAIEPFLYRLFSDPDVINFPFARLARAPLARLVARQRSRKVRERYAAIGGHSPITELTFAQARALENELQKHLAARVHVAMRYWHPLTEETAAVIRRESPDQLILLPLYPQFSRVTTGSSLNEWNRCYRAGGGNHIPASVIREFHNQELYIDAVVRQINLSLQRFPPGAMVHLVFSAHGVPVSVIEEGDPYRDQVEQTVQLVTRRGAWWHPHCLCYQSKVGPGRWLQPMLRTTLQALRQQGARFVLVIPIAFVSEHIETLYEIDIEAREQAAQLGFAQFETMPALNDSPVFIRALRDLVLEAARSGV